MAIPEPATRPITRTAATPSAKALCNEVLTDAMPSVVFVLDPDGVVRLWNRAAEEFTGTDRADVVGTAEVSTAFYQDGRSAQTLADKVVEAPESADEVFGVSRSTDVSYTRYEDTSTMVNAASEEVDIWFTAAPIYDDGAFVGVVEVVEDRSERSAMERLVSEVNGTLSALGAGDLSARATFEDPEDRLGTDRLSVVAHVNDAAENIEGMYAQVSQETEALIVQTAKTAELANEIESLTDDQYDDLDQVVEEMEAFSATMEEVAATAQEVTNAAEQARNAATAGQRSGERAGDAMDETDRTGEDLVTQMNALEARIDGIVEVVDVIDAVADQTNLLALNASIEAARAGEAGAGFAVVADEVKALAEETQEHTDRIGGQITDARRAMTETMRAVEASNERIDETSEEIDAIGASLAEITTAVDEATDGIEDVARANDEQAVTVEQVTALSEGVAEDARRVRNLVDTIASTADEQERSVAGLAERVGKLEGRGE